ncbi:hypothetical protein C8Q79DRAFT_985235 [Trametes meyenii]|nr:hypothetical protein C8Q79DRAFT_985235 [Trametes meyenii]
MELPVTRKRQLATPRKTTSVERRANKRPKQARLHVSLRRSMKDKVGVSATVEDSGRRFNNIFTVDDHPGTNATTATTPSTSYTELTFLQPETIPSGEVPIQTEHDAPPMANAPVSHPSCSARSMPEQPLDAWVYRAARSGRALPVPLDDPMPPEAQSATSHPSGYAPWPQAFPPLHHEADNRSSLNGWPVSSPERVAEDAYLTQRRFNSSGISPSAVPPALGYDGYLCATEYHSDGEYTANHRNTFPTQRMPSQPFIVEDEHVFAPQPFINDVTRLDSGVTEQLGVRLRSGAYHHLYPHSAVWPSGEDLLHEKVKTIHNETAQGAQFGIVYSQTCSCGRNAHEQVGCLCKSETTDAPWSHANPHTYHPSPSAHTWQEWWSPEGPVSIESTAGWDEYPCSAPAQDIGHTQMARALDPRLAAYCNDGLPGANVNATTAYPASIEGFEDITPYAGEGVQPGWGTVGMGEGPSYRWDFDPWY